MIYEYNVCPSCGVNSGQGCYSVCITSEVPTLRAEIKRLRAALEPFAKAADSFDGDKGVIKYPPQFAYGGGLGSGETTGAITVGDLRRARVALADEKSNV